MSDTVDLTDEQKAARKLLARVAELEDQLRGKDEALKFLAKVFVRMITDARAKTKKAAVSIARSHAKQGRTAGWRSFGESIACALERM